MLAVLIQNAIYPVRTSRDKKDLPQIATHLAQMAPSRSSSYSNFRRLGIDDELLGGYLDIKVGDNSSLMASNNTQNYFHRVSF